MQLTRRSFLQQLLAGGVATALTMELDLERLLWVPKRMIVVPELPAKSWRVDFAPFYHSVRGWGPPPAVINRTTREGLQRIWIQPRTWRQIGRELVVRVDVDHRIIEPG